MDSAEAMEWVTKHGIVLVSGKSKRVPTLVDAIADEAVKGSWWVHPKAHAIFRVLSVLADSPDVKTFRLVDDKLTVIHRRLWPALVAIADEIGKRRLTALSQKHTRQGAHRSVRVQFPKWVPKEVALAAKRIQREDARTMLAALF